MKIGLGVDLGISYMPTPNTGKLKALIAERIKRFYKNRGQHSPQQKIT